jgi:hypothetical protein
VVIDKCVSHAVGNHILLQRSKSNKTKTFLNKVTALDIAYTICVNKNSKEVWEEDLQIKASSKDYKKRHHTTHHKQPMYHEGRGKCLKRYNSGWTDNGQDYNQELLRIFKDLKSSDVWKTLQDQWKLYQKKYNDKGDNQDKDSKAQEEECEEIDEGN